MRWMLFASTVDTPNSLFQTWAMVAQALALIAQCVATSQRSLLTTSLRACA
jgi:hypothetical protein